MSKAERAEWRERRFELDPFDFLASHPGNPLGHGMPSGAPLREDGETHREAWKRILRSDPCAYCGTQPGGTLDHIIPSSAGTGDLHVWLNYTGACTSCNGSKSNKPLLLFLLSRRGRRRARAGNALHSASQ